MKTQKILSILFIIGLSRVYAQGTDIELPGPGILKNIFNKPGIIKTEVSQERGDDKIRWVEMYIDVHIVTDIPMEKLRRAILDFDNYPRIFRRNKGISVIRENDTAYLDMAVGAEFLGISFITNYRVLVSELLNTADEFVLDFSHVSDDGNVKDVYGRWYLKKIPRSGNGEDRFYVRYYASSKVMRKYPLLRMIMAMFIDGESRDLMKQFLKAAENN
ncbi:SRPBCC family protein [Treponema primitia]|uniref:SRPBCC family protein n=1 Tax=Treponema primitia TaxID=88058 RepID=UPI00397F99F1